MTSRSDSMRFFLYFLFFYIVPVLTTRSVGLSLRRYHLQVGIIMIIYFVRCLIEVFPSWLFRRFNSISSAAVLKVWSFSIRDFNFFSLSIHCCWPRPCAHNRLLTNVWMYVVDDELKSEKKTLFSTAAAEWTKIWGNLLHIFVCCFSSFRSDFALDSFESSSSTLLAGEIECVRWFDRHRSVSSSLVSENLSLSPLCCIDNLCVEKCDDENVSAFPFDDK